MPNVSGRMFPYTAGKAAAKKAAKKVAVSEEDCKAKRQQKLQQRRSCQVASRMGRYA